MKPRHNRWWLIVCIVVLAATALTAVALARGEIQNGSAMMRVTVASDAGRDSRRASVSADGGLVAFHSDSDLMGQGIPDNQFEIWLYDTATLTYTRVTRATDADRDSFSPRLSADGTALIFYSDADFLNEGIPDNQKEVWMYDVAGATFTRLTTASSGDRGSWSESVSADGTVAALVSDSDFLGQGIADDQFEVWLYDTTTLTCTRVTTASDAARESYSPRLNADGTLVAFSSDSDFLGQGIEDDQFEIWLYDVTGGSLTRVTYAPDGSRGSYAPSLSADGTQLTFISDVDILGQGVAAGQVEVWLYDVASGVFTRATNTETGRRSDFPVLNADGTRLAFESDADFLGDGDIAAGHYEIWFYDVPSAGLTRVTTGSEPGRRSLRTSLTAAGDRVAFESSSDFLGQGIASEQYEIWIFSLPGFMPTLTKAVDETAPQPGQRITYTLRVVNPLDAGISNAVISDTLPPGLTFAGPVTLEPPQSSAVLAGSARDLPALATALKIPAGSTITVTFPVTVNADVAWATIITNTASFTTPHILTPTFGAVAVNVRFRVIAATPSPNSHVAASAADLTFVANDTLDGSTVVTDAFFVHGGFQGRLDGALSFGGVADPASVTFDPVVALHPGELVRASVTVGIRNATGVATVPYVWTFRAATLGGTAAFVAHPVTPTLPTFQSIGVALGDLDGDRDLDVVLANANDAPDTVWLNDGDGGLYPHPARPSFGPEETSWDVALGDLDNDGDLDAVVAGVVTDTVWLNDGTGRFAPQPTTPELGAAISRHVALGDLDGDGDLDVVFAHFHQPDTVWMNGGNGDFTPNPSMPAFGTGSSFDVALGDLDGDGDLDALVTKVFLSDVVWLNDGTGKFSYRGTLGSGSSYGLDLGDVDGDGDLDAVIARSGDQPEAVWVNDDTGLFSPHPTTPGFGAGSSRDVALGDLDGDGDLDAVVANSEGQPQTVWLNDGAGNFTAQPDVPAFGGGYSSALVLGDLDGDGDLDTVIGDSSSFDVSVWLNRGPYRIMLPLVLRDAAASP